MESSEEKVLSKREVLFNAGVQYGHMKSVWCPKMKPFIWGEKNGLHLINIALTEIQLNKAEALIESIAEKGLPILFVGTKRVAKNIIRKKAEECGCSYFADRWIGGTLTNYSEVRKAVKKLLHNTDIYEKSDRDLFTKKELGIIKKKVDRAAKTVGGIQNLTYPIGCLATADAIRDRVAIREAIILGVPVISIVDTNSDPSGITIPIPSNDDLERSLESIFSYLAAAVIRGKEKFIAKNPLVSAIKEVGGEKQQDRKKFKKHSEQRHDRDGLQRQQHEKNLKKDLDSASQENMSSEMKTDNNVTEQEGITQSDKIASFGKENKSNEASRKEGKDHDIKKASLVTNNKKQIFNKNSPLKKTLISAFVKKKDGQKDSESGKIETNFLKKKSSKIEASTKSVKKDDQQSSLKNIDAKTKKGGDSTVVLDDEEKRVSKKTSSISIKKGKQVQF